MKNKAIITAELLLLAMIITAAAVFGGQPGGEDDPIVSKSYVDDRINQLKELINGGENQTADKDEIIAEIMEKLGANGSEGSKYIPVFLSSGQILYGGEGAEIILRSGVAYTSISSDAGIVNATEGSELPDKAAVKRNNIHIIPRDDGRGIRVTEDAWFIVKGEYRIE